MEKTLVSVMADWFERQPQHPAQRFKSGEVWKDISYGQMGKHTREIAAGLHDLGLAPGKRAAILSNNSVQWAWTDLGILFAGGVTVTIYPNSIPREVKYILENSDSQIVFVEDAEQLQKVMDIRKDIPQLKKAVLLDNGRVDDDFVIKLDDLMQLGSKYLAENPKTLKKIAADMKTEQMAIIIYTSGTTGPPKGVMLSHGNILFVIDTVSSSIKDLSKFQLNLSFLPLSHALERIGGHFTPLIMGRTIGYAESLDKIGDNFREIKPDLACAVPRVFEKVYARIQDQIAKSPPIRKKIFNWALSVGKKAILYKQKGKSLPPILSMQCNIADKLVFEKIRQVLGGNMKYFISGGAPLDAKIAEFFFAMGITVLEAWGATESSAPATFNLPEAFKIGSVGRPLQGVEVRVEEDGELLIRGPNVCLGYWKMPEQTAETFDQEGWYHTGDVGHIDDDGFIYITDRKKELIITSGGKNISPQNIENKLKLSPFISNAMTYGDKRNYLTALITIDVEAVFSALRLPDSDTSQLSENEKVIDLVQAEVDRINKDLPRFEQIKKFRIPPEDFTVEADELSPSLKLKRRNILAHYGNLIEEMYQ